MRAVPWRQPYVFVRPLPSPVASPSSPESRSRSTRARSRTSAGRTGRARRACSACAVASSPCIRVRPRCSATISRTTAALSAGAWVCSGHQSFLYEELTVEENLRFALRACGTDARQAGAALARLGLAGRLCSTPVEPALRWPAAPHALWRSSSLATPRVWLLDEPHAGLDQRGPRAARRAHRRVEGEGPTVLLCSHEPERAAGLSDRVIWLAGTARCVGGAGRCCVTRGWSLRKDLRIELRSRVAAQPGGAVLRCRPPAVRPRPRAGPHGARTCGSRPLLDRRALVVPCSPSSAASPIEAADGARDGLRLLGPRSGRDLPRQGARLVVQLLVLEALLAVGVARAVRARSTEALVLVACLRHRDGGPGAVGVLYGALSLRPDVKETLLPLLFLPVAAPGAPRGDEGLGRGSRRDAGPGRRVAVAAGGVRRRLRGRSGPSPSARCWRTVMRRDRPACGYGLAGARRRRRHRLARAVGDAEPVELPMGTVRLLYIHPPLAWVAVPRVRHGGARLEPAVPVAADPRTSRWDRLAGASAEVGVVFTGLTLVTGRSGGDPPGASGGPGTRCSPRRRCSSSSISATSRCGACPATRDGRRRRSPSPALVAFLDVPIVYFSVSWWRSLHQGPTIDLATRHMLRPRLDGLDAAARLRRRSRSRTSG